MKVEQSEDERQRVEEVLVELENMKLDLDALPEDAPEQFGGKYRDMRGREISGETGEAHHVIPKSIVEGDSKEESVVLLEHDDHSDQPSTGGKINHSYRSVFMGGEEVVPFREEMKQMLEDGRYIELVRCNVLDIRRTAYDTKAESYAKYDEAIRQYLDAEIEYVKKYGISEARKDGANNMTAYETSRLEGDEQTEKTDSLLEGMSITQLRELKDKVEQRDPETMRGLSEYLEGDDTGDDGSDDPSVRVRKRTR